MLTSLRHHATTLAICTLFATITIAGSATAARLVTGADIKNNTISTLDIKDQTLKLGDLSAGAADTLEGQRGPAGPRGATGPAGPAGPAGTGGSAAPTGIQVVTGAFPSQVLVNTSTYVASGQVTCPSGKYLLASGHAFTDKQTPGQEITLDSMVPTAGSSIPNGVQASATSLGKTFTLAISAYCATIPA